MAKLECNYIVIDTTTKVLKTAAFFESKSHYKVINDGFYHLENLLPAIDALLKENNLDKLKINKIFVVTGPGSFTGLRIGITTAISMAFGLSIEVIGFSIFDVYNFLLNTNPELSSLDIAIPVIDAKKSSFFCTFLTDKDVKPLLLSDMFDLTPIDLYNKLTEYNPKNACFFGADFNLIKLRDERFATFKHIYEADYSASDLIDFCNYIIDRKINYRYPEPVYLRKSEAENMLLKKKLLLE